MRLAIILALGGFGCISENGGTAVGNPTSMEPTLARTGGVTLTTATLPVQLVSAVDCDANWTNLEVEEFDLLDRDPIPTPDGYCRFVVVPSAPLEFEGYTPSLELSGSIDIPPLFLVADAPVTEPATVLEFGTPNWLESGSFGAGSVVLDPEDEAYASVARALVTGTALWADPNRDGQVSAQERSAGPLAIPADEVEDDAELEAEDGEDDADDDEGEEKNGERDDGGFDGDE